MNNTTFYGAVTLPDTHSLNAMQSIDLECSSCLREAAKLASGDVLDAVISNELTENERLAVKLRWYKNQTPKQIAAVTGTDAQNIRNILKRAQKKIYASMKYVVLYNQLVCGHDAPADFHFKIIDPASGKELLS